MTIEQFRQIKSRFDQGLIPIQNAHLDAFLFDNKWYPLRSFVNQIHQATNHKAIKELVLLIPYLRIKEDVDFTGCNNYPIQIDNVEKLEELRLLSDRSNNLISQLF